jgi:fumarate reductase subunit C
VGVAHAVPTRQVLAGFAPVTISNRRIVLQEWLAEAFTMWGIAALVIAVTAVGGTDTGARVWVYRVAAGLLVALGILTALTGARNPVVWFKICPVLLAGSAVLLLAASLL